MTNSTTMQSLLEDAKTLGEQAGKGKDTQIKFLLKAVEGGYHNAIDLAGNKHGKDIDDATKLGEVYTTAQQGATVFDAKAPNNRKLISTIRTSIRLGMWPKGGNGEPLGTVNNLISMRQKLRQNPAEAKKLDDAANTLLKYARAQLKRDQLIDDGELKEFCYKPTAPLRTAEQIIESCRDQLDSLIRGTAAQNTAQDANPEVVAAKNALTQRLKNIATARSGHKIPALAVVA